MPPVNRQGTGGGIGEDPYSGPDLATPAATVPYGRVAAGGERTAVTGQLQPEVEPQPSQT
ncbi:hypothetical protein GCM10023321_71060 [Pseudonocardia eucalypti]|uniref:Uncharacterized protein n=1 Tax=Pseudonocardia eucalypti TaxID=648755 RepID=A0ABP9R6Z1_9PSEU